MKQERSHRKDITGCSRTQDVAFDRNIANLRRGKNATEVTARDDTESARVAIGRVKMETKSNELGERLSVWLCIGDSIPDAVLSPRLVADRQNAILVTGDGPVSSRMLIKIRRVDRECWIAKQLRSKRGQAAGLEQRGQVLNFPKEGTRSEGIAHPMKNRTCGQLGLRRPKEVLTRSVIDNASNEHKARVHQFSRHAAAQLVFEPHTRRKLSPIAR